MSMSTKIEDLPGSTQIVQQPTQQSNVLQQVGQPVQQIGIPVVQQSQTSPVQMDVKKKVRFKDENEVFEIDSNEPPKKTSFFQKIKAEFNEENILLLIFLYIASTSYLDGYISLMPIVGQYTLIPGLFTVIKSVVLLLMFIISKIFLLPYFQL